MGFRDAFSPICNGRRKLQLIRSSIIALAAIAFVYFQIHSCSKDDIAAPDPPPAAPDNVICAASDVYFADSEFGCVSGIIGTMMTTGDGGATWNGFALPAGTLNDVQLMDRSRGWVAGKDGALYSTIDGGASWERNPIQGCPADEDFYEVQFFNERLGYLLGYRGLYRTDDGGASWANNWLPVVANRGALDVSFVNDRTAFLLGSRYLETDPVCIYRTVNGGEAWHPVEGSRASTMRTVMTIWFADEATGWAGGGVIMKTANGGASWTTQVSPATVREFFFFDTERGFAIGGATILRTEDGGASWVNVTPADGRIADLRGIHFLDTMTGWVVGRGTDAQVGDRLCKRSLLLVTSDGGASWKVREFLYDYALLAGASGAAEE